MTCSTQLNNHQSIIWIRNNLEDDGHSEVIAHNQQILVPDPRFNAVVSISPVNTVSSSLIVSFSFSTIICRYLRYGCRCTCLQRVWFGVFKKLDEIASNLQDLYSSDIGILRVRLSRVQMSGDWTQRSWRNNLTNNTPQHLPESSVRSGQCEVSCCHHITSVFTHIHDIPGSEPVSVTINESQWIVYITWSLK